MELDELINDLEALGGDANIRTAPLTSIILAPCEYTPASPRRFVWGDEGGGKVHIYDPTADSDAPAAASITSFRVR
jgi:hypothetical protein